ncbi:MAG: site-2 protease family protein [Candidatus Methanoperedens sp.]|nr:site-2 protease family protein [Candidatus Methanoperedens sp.]
MEKGQKDFEKYHSETVRIRSLRSIRTSNTELLHILISWFAVSYAFAILLMWFKLNTKPTSGELLNGIFNPLVISLSTVGISFIVHEMSHKVIAQRYGSWAEFRMSPIMLALMLILVYEFGILFAAPGAVMIYGGSVGRRESGRISLAGPLSNMLLALAFFPLLSETGILYEIGRYGVIINITLALFNMIPFSVFDGRKVWAWNKIIYLGFVITTILLLMAFVAIQLIPSFTQEPF